MTDTRLSEVRQAVIDAAAAIAPEADFSRVDPERSLREQLDLDSFDFLNLLIALRERLGIEVPESDYGKVDSLDRLAGYLRARLP
ncbi:MAG TPA: acyl carrier protein [Albitalea sp.]